MKLNENLLVPIDVNGDPTLQINTAIEIARLYKFSIRLLAVIPDEDLSKKMKKLVTKSVTDAINSPS